MKELIDPALKFLPNLVTALVVFIIGFWLAGLLARLTERALSHRKKNVTLTLFIKNLVYYESPGTTHEWLTWRRSLEDFAPRLFR